MALSNHLEAMPERIALIDKDGVDAVDAGPAGDARPDGGDAAQFGRAFDPPLQEIPSASQCRRGDSNPHGLAPTGS